MKNEEGKPITVTQEQQDSSDYRFEILFNKPVAPNSEDIEPQHKDYLIDVTPSTTKDIFMSIRQMECGKTARLDNISAEALKSNKGVTAKMCT